MWRPGRDPKVHMFMIFTVICCLLPSLQRKEKQKKNSEENTGGTESNCYVYKLPSKILLKHLVKTQINDTFLIEPRKAVLLETT